MFEFIITVLGMILTWVLLIFTPGIATAIFLGIMFWKFPKFMFGMVVVSLALFCAFLAQVYTWISSWVQSLA